MAKINLLPWRVERRKQREREFQVMMGGALLFGAIAVVFALTWMGRVLDGHQARNDLLNREIAALDAKIKEIEALREKREELLRRKEIIERLQSSRYQMVHVFDELVRTLPDGVRLTEMSQSGESVNLIGMAQSNARVSAYMRNIEAAEWLRLPDLRKTEIVGDEKNGRYKFALGVSLKKSEDEKTEEEQAAEAAAGATPASGGAP